MKKINLLLGIVIILMAILVYAAPPTTPVVTAPTNNSVVFNAVNLSVGGSIDPESDLFNFVHWYVFNETNNVNLSNASSGIHLQPNFDRVNHNEWKTDSGGGAPSFTLGTSDQDRYTASNPTDTFNMWLDAYTFNADDFYILIDETTGGNVKIFVDGTLIKSFSNKALQWARLDVSEFNDGSTHQLNITSLGAGTTTSFWFPFTQFTWKAQACDVNNECSSNTSDQTLNFIDVFRVTQGTNRAYNFTFEQENATGTKINGRIFTFNLNFTDSDDLDKSLIGITGEDENNSYGYAMYPINITRNARTTLTYGATGYQTRQLIIDQDINGTDTLDKTLFLLGTADGIFTTFQTVTQSGQTIAGVQIVAESRIDGTFKEVASGLTDDAGAITMFLDPDVLHRIKATKSGFGDVVLEVSPTSSAFTITMTSTTTFNQTNFNQGIIFNIDPTNVTLSNWTNYTFGFNLTSQNLSLSNFGFNLLNSSDDVLISLTNTTSTSGGFLFQELNTTNNTELRMEYFWTTQDKSQNATKFWRVVFTQQGDFSLKTFFDDLRTFTNLQKSGLSDFTLAIIAFIITIIIVASISLITGIVTPTAITGIVAALTWFFEYVGMYPTIGTEWFLSIIMGMLFLAMWIFETTR